MAALIVDSKMSNIQGTSQESRPSLRRATYVHVSDLTSVYNIDHAMLEQELKRVKIERERGTFAEPPKAHDMEDTEDDPIAGTSEIDPCPQKRLQPPRSGYNLCVLVGKVTLVVDKKRVDQSRVRLAEVEIGDETGTVSLRARDEQIDLLEDVSRRSGAVVLRNCTLELYQGKHIRLAVTKWGKLSLYPDHVASTPPAPSKMNFDRNFSAIDLSVVASEMVDAQAETVYGRHAKQQSDTPDSGTRPLSSKTAIQGKHQQSQTSSRRVGRERRQSKGKPGCNPASQSHYIGHSSEHMTVATQLNPMRYTGVHHPYPLYDPAMDLRQYHYARHHQEASLAPASAQQLMMQRQYELQQRQLHHMYHGQQERHRAGMSSSQQVQPAGLLLQAAVPPGSFDANDFHVPSYASATSSPILIPVAVPGAHGKSNLRLHTSTPVESEAHDSSPIAQEKQSTQYVSVSPDDSSQMSYGRMNPDATAFAPSYLGAAQSATHQVYFPYDPSHHHSAGVSYPQQSHHQAIYAGGLMYVPAPPTESQTDFRSNVVDSGTKGTNDGTTGKENVETD